MQGAGKQVNSHHPSGDTLTLTNLKSNMAYSISITTGTTMNETTLSMFA